MKKKTVLVLNMHEELLLSKFRSYYRGIFGGGEDNDDDDNNDVVGSEDYRDMRCLERDENHEEAAEEGFFLRKISMFSKRGFLVRYVTCLSRRD